MKKYASYNHLSSCELGEWQGLVRGSRYNIKVTDALDYIEEHQRLLTLAMLRNITAVVHTVHLADFLFHKIKFPENKSKRVRAIKNKVKMPRSRFNSNKWFSDRRSHIKDIFDLLKHPLRQEGDNECQVGPFTLKNPINLNRDKVLDMEKVIKKALTLCTNSLAPNFTQALYGDVVLVEKLERANWYARYNPTKDEITMKFMDRKQEDFLKTFIHEIGHRYYRKVLSRQSKNLWRQYDMRCASVQRINLRDWDGQDIGLYAKINRAGNNKLTRNSNGAKKTTLTISRFGSGVYLTTEDNDILGPYREKVIKREIKSLTGLYPTQYATTDGEEHFCEAIAYKAVGKLHPKSLEAFNSIIVDGVEYLPDASNFKGKFEPQVTPPSAPQQTQVEQTLPSKQEQVRSCESLANKLSVGFKKGRKYGMFIYTNDAVGSTHAYMFIDYATGNLFVPKAKDAPNLKVNIGNITDGNVENSVGFDRMSNLRPRWRTMNSITQPTKAPPSTEIIDQTPEPSIPTTPEGNLDSIKDAARSLSQSLGLEYQEMRKFLRLIYTNEDTIVTKHSYLFIDKQNGSIHPPKAHDAPKKNVTLGSILEPNVTAKVTFDAMTQNDRNWRRKYRIKGR
jgi:hypothetical protein